MWVTSSEEEREYQLTKWRGWRDGSVGKVLLHEQEDLSSLCRNDIMRQGWWLVLAILALRNQRQVDPWSSLASQPQLTKQWAPSQGKTCLRKNEVDNTWVTPHLRFSSDLHIHVLCTHTCTCMHTYTYVCTCMQYTYTCMHTHVPAYTHRPACIYTWTWCTHMCSSMHTHKHK